MGNVLCEFNSANGYMTAAWTRSGPSKSTPTAGILYKKDCTNGQFYIDSNDGGPGDYYRVVNGSKYGLTEPAYIRITTSYLKYPKPSEIKPTTTATQTVSNPNTGSVEKTSSFKYSQDLDDKIYSLLTSSRKLDELKNNTRVFGLPFQFTNVADNRPFTDNNLDYGRKYIENIIAEEPVVYLTPGIPNYMPDADPATKETVDAFIKARSSNSNISPEVQEKLLEQELRYYDFVPAYSEYTRYVNLLCRISAQYMGIDNLTVPFPGSTETYKSYDWGRWSNLNYTTDSDDKVVDGGIWGRMSAIMRDGVDKVKDDIFGDYKYVKCYVDPSSSFSESSSNSSQQSQIAGLFDNLEGIMKEVGFFTNNSGGIESVIDLTAGAASGLASSIPDVFDPETNSGLSKIIGNATHILAG